MTNKFDNSPSFRSAKNNMKHRFLALALATTDVVYSLSPDWEVMHALDGRGFLLDTDKPIREWKKINVFAEDISIVDEAIAEAISQKKIFALEHRVNRADGTIGWTFSRAIPILDDNGEILEWLGAASDITARKEAEFALHESRAHALEQKRVYETITSGTPDLIYVFDLSYRFTYANEALLAMWGKSAEDAIGKGLLENGYELWHAEMHWREIDKVVATGKPIRGEVSFKHAVLGKRIYDYIFTPVFGSLGKVEAVAGTTRDVTDLRHTMEALQKTTEELQATNEELAASNEALLAANEKLQLLNDDLLKAKQKISETETAVRQAVEAANFGTWLIRPETMEFVADDRVKQLLGYYPDEDPTFDDLLARVTDDYGSKVSAKVEDAMKNNGVFDVTCPVVGLHDNKLRWLRVIGNFTSNRMNVSRLCTGLLIDVTEQTNDEIRKNDFIAMVSHELKTPLTSMKAYVQIALEKMKPFFDEIAIVAMKKANIQADKMAKMINGFLNLSRLESGKIGINHELFDLADLMQEVKEETEAIISSHKIIFEPVDSAMINADQEKISHVIHNLISNAVKYAPHRSMIKVSCTNDGENALISVTDQGIGIPHQYLLKIFDRYFRVENTRTTKVTGFGIGLYICKEIILGHKGQIWAQSEPGKGSIFSFSIPMPDVYH